MEAIKRMGSQCPGSKYNHFIRRRREMERRKSKKSKERSKEK